jgi:hypothetical protein
MSPTDVELRWPIALVAMFDAYTDFVSSRQAGIVLELITKGGPRHKRSSTVTDRLAVCHVNRAGHNEFLPACKATVIGGRMELIMIIVVIGGIAYFFRKNGGSQTASGSSTPYWKQKYGHLSAEERKLEYRRRGKSPSGVIDGVYNDMYREDGRPYSDAERDWDADA